MSEGCSCNRWIPLIGLLSGALLAVSGTKLIQHKSDLILPESGCALHLHECEASLPDGALTLNLVPKPAKCLEPLHISLKLDGRQPLLVSLDIQGIAFPEAFYRATLAQADDSFQGTAILPLCSTSSMDWQARLILDYGDHEVMAPFPLTTLGG